MSDLSRAKELVFRMMDEFPELYAKRGKAFRVEFFEWDGKMLLSIRSVPTEQDK